jgi:outer membrane immunogenic protein
MKNIALAAVAAATFVATPAFATNPFTGVRAEVTAGLDDVTGARDRTNITYGAAAGLDAEIFPRVVIGAEATVDNVFEHRNIGAGARLGYVLGDSVLVYTKAGWANLDPARNGVALDGFRLGGGIEARVVSNLYTKVEYRYTDLDGNVGQHQGLIGLGVRF